MKEAVARIALTSGFFAIVDSEDLDKLDGRKWYASIDSGGAFAACWRNQTDPIECGKNIRMSRFILGITDPSIEIYHLNRNRLDNRKENLKICPTHQNVCQIRHGNKNAVSKYKGVYRDNHRAKRRKRWVGCLTLNKKRHCKRFLTEEEAAHFYDDKAKELLGEFAHLNFPI